MGLSVRSSLPPAQCRVMEYLDALPGHDYADWEEIAGAVGSSQRGVNNVLNRLLDAGLVTCVSDGKFDCEWRAVRGRCEALLREEGRTWRCQKEALHSGMHSNRGGGRRW